MLIKRGDLILNSEAITSINKDREERNMILFRRHVGVDCIRFSSEEEANKALDKILDAYRWQRQVCDLDQI